MNKELISPKQAIAILYLFLVGSNIVLGVSPLAVQDSWISVLAAMLFMLPLAVIYARIIRLYPEKSLFDILIIVFGKAIGKIFAVLYTWYALHLGAVVMRDFAEFLESSAMPDMPQLPMYILMIILSVYAVKCGVETFGRSALILAPVMILLLIFTIVFSFQVFDYSHLQPVFGQGAKKILSAAFIDLTFPFAETVVFLGAAYGIRAKDNPYKIFIFGVLIGGVAITLSTLKNILVLGFPFLTDSYFPAYVAAKMIIIGEGDTLSRVESSVSAIFILSGYVKVSVCLFAASKGLSKLFNIEDHKKMVIPAAALMIALAGTLYSSIMELFDFLDTYKYYALPFQVLFPIIIWIFAEIKRKKERAKQS